MQSTSTTWSAAQCKCFHSFWTLEPTQDSRTFEPGFAAKQVGKGTIVCSIFHPESKYRFLRGTKFRRRSETGFEQALPTPSRHGLCARAVVCRARRVAAGQGARTCCACVSSRVCRCSSDPVACRSWRAARSSRSAPQQRCAGVGVLLTCGDEIRRIRGLAIYCCGLGTRRLLASLLGMNAHRLTGRRKWEGGSPALSARSKRSSRSARSAASARASLSIIA